MYFHRCLLSISYIFSAFFFFAAGHAGDTVHRADAVFVNGKHDNNSNNDSDDNGRAQISLLPDDFDTNYIHIVWRVTFEVFHRPSYIRWNTLNHTVGAGPMEAVEQRAQSVANENGH